VRNAGISFQGGGIMDICSTLWNRACNYLFFREDITGQEKKPEEEMLKEAHQALIAAQNLFACADDPDMIDYAIYNLKAAEKRYNFLIKTIKKQRTYKKY